MKNVYFKLSTDSVVLRFWQGPGKTTLSNNNFFYDLIILTAPQEISIRDTCMMYVLAQKQEKEKKWQNHTSNMNFDFYAYIFIRIS